MENHRLPPSQVFWIGFGFEAGLLALAAFLGWLLEVLPLPIRFDWDGVLLGLLGTLPPAIYALLATSELGLRLSPVRGIYDRIRDLLGEAIAGMALWQLGLLALAAGFGEEFLFRGVLQVAWGLGTSSVIFALLHAVTPAYFFMALGLSVYLGWIFHETENLLVPSLIHFLYDTLALVLLRRKFREEELERSRRT